MAAFALLLLGSVSARGSVVFDWPGSGWTAGAPTPGQTKTQNFTNFAPNDITVSINNNGVSGTGATWQAAYPAINSTQTTGGFTGVNGLQLYVSAQSAKTSYIRTTFSFASPATGVTFQLWDVDASAGQFVDRISNIQALAVGGATVGADSVSSAVAGYNTITGTGLTTVITGTAGASNTTNQGTINITFNGPITQFSFDWLNNDNGLGAQAIGLGPITYAPEVCPSWASALVCAFAISGHEVARRRRSSRRPKRP